MSEDLKNTHRVIALSPIMREELAVRICGGKYSYGTECKQKLLGVQSLPGSWRWAGLQSRDLPPTKVAADSRRYNNQVAPQNHSKEMHYLFIY